jgi:Trypsin-like peptidase domain
MPRIPDSYIGSVIYIYSSEAEAIAGGKFGGSGFLAQIPYPNNQEFGAIYAVTNNHVINSAGDAPILRINKKDGKADTLKTNKNDWVRHPYAADIAACLISIPQAQYEYFTIGPHMFLTKQIIEEQKIGPGDDVFMAGRFVNVGGIQKNTPALRFGNIAMMPEEPIEDQYGVKQESFLIECRSIPGYSGSPVFVWINPDLPRPPLFGTGIKIISGKYKPGPWLLGVDWCHISNYEPIFESEGGKRTRRADLVARSNTSMAGVIPAWLLMDLLNAEEFVKQREEDDRAATQQKSSHSR